MNNQALFDALKNKYVKVKRSGEWFRIPCPTCREGHRQKMKRHVHVSGTANSHCFICGVKLSVYDLTEGYFVPTAAEQEAYSFDEDVDDKFVDPRSLRLPCSKSIPVNKLPSNHPAIEFLRKDELHDLDTYANKYGIVYVPFEGGEVISNGARFITSAERLIFPILFEHKLVGWQMRSLPGTFYGDMDDVIRYYQLFNKGNYLYNYDYAKEYRRVIVVEGVKKALKFPNAVATWGAGISSKQMRMIQTWPEVIMMLDSDANNNTQERARTMVENLNRGGACRAINVDLSKYGLTERPVSSPDDLPADVLQLIADEEWNNQKGISCMIKQHKISKMNCLPNLPSNATTVLQ